MDRLIDHRMLHKTTGEVDSEPLQSSPEWWRQPAGHGMRCDVTIVALSYMVIEAQRAAKLLERFGIACSIFDPLWIRPLPCLPAVAADVARTKRLLVVDCGWPTYGFSAEVVAGVAERTAIEKVARMGFAETVCPTSHSLEALYYPTAETIAAKAYEMVTGEKMPAIEKNGAAPEVEGFRGPF